MAAASHSTVGWLQLPVELRQDVLRFVSDLGLSDIVHALRVNREWNLSPILLKGLLKCMRPRLLPKLPLYNYEVKCSDCGVVGYEGNHWAGLRYKTWCERRDGSVVEHVDLACKDCIHGAGVFSSAGTDLTFLVPAQDMAIPGQKERVLSASEIEYVEELHLEQMGGGDDEEEDDDEEEEGVDDE